MQDTYHISDKCNQYLTQYVLISYIEITISQNFSFEDIIVSYSHEETFLYNKF